MVGIEENRQPAFLRTIVYNTMYLISMYIFTELVEDHVRIDHPCEHDLSRLRIHINQQRLGLSKWSKYAIFYSTNEGQFFSIIIQVNVLLGLGHLQILQAPAPPSSLR